MLWRGILLLSCLSGCGLAPRAATGDELVDAVLIRIDPIGGCVTIDGQTRVFVSGGPSDPPGLVTEATFTDAQVRAAAKAIAIPYREYVRQIEQPEGDPEQSTDNCVMEVSPPAFSGAYAFVNYSSPSGVLGVYAFHKGAFGWKVVEHKKLGYW